MQDTILDDGLVEEEKQLLRTSSIVTIEKVILVGIGFYILSNICAIGDNGFLFFHGILEWLQLAICNIAVLWWRKISLFYDRQRREYRVHVPRRLVILRLVLLISVFWDLFTSFKTAGFIFVFFNGNTQSGFMSRDYPLFFLGLILNLIMALSTLYYLNITQEATKRINRN